MKISVPSEYEAFLPQHGPFEGFVVGVGGPGYIELWELKDIHDNNQDVAISEHAPGFLAFAGNGGGEVLAFDVAGAVYMLPLIGMAPDTAVKVANCFGELAFRFELPA